MHLTTQAPLRQDTGEFYKEPMFYAMGHFSKFIGPASRRTHSSVFGTEAIKVTAVHNAEDKTSTVVLLNT